MTLVEKFSSKAYQRSYKIQEVEISAKFTFPTGNATGLFYFLHNDNSFTCILDSRNLCLYRKQG